MNQRVATCSCGQLSLTCQGEPVRISVCHCLACQRRTGSVFGAQARFPTPQVAASGRTSIYVDEGEGGNRATFRFCPDCGSTVYWELSALPGFTAVAIGAFADPTFPPPRVSVYEERRHAWVTIPGDDVEHLD